MAMLNFSFGRPKSNEDLADKNRFNSMVMIVCTVLYISSHFLHYSNDLREKGYLSLWLYVLLSGLSAMLAALSLLVINGTFILTKDGSRSVFMVAIALMTSVFFHPFRAALIICIIALQYASFLFYRFWIRKNGRKILDFLKLIWFILFHIVATGGMLPVKREPEFMMILFDTQAVLLVVTGYYFMITSWRNGSLLKPEHVNVISSDLG